MSSPDHGAMFFAIAPKRSAHGCLQPVYANNSQATSISIGQNRYLAFAQLDRRHTAGQEATIGQGHSIQHRANGTYCINSATKPPVKSNPNRDINSRNTHNHNAKKEAPMIQYHFNLKANVEACFRRHRIAVALSGCIAVAAAVHGPSGTQPYAS